MADSKKKRHIVLISCIFAGICLMGAAVTAFFLLQRNPLAKGLAGLAEEVTALEAEMGKHFWADAVSRIGSGNIQAEYSLNVGGIEELRNITVGLDGKTKRDMEQLLFETDLRLSVANAELAETSFYGTSDTLYVQFPSLWDGSVVLDTENVSGQWDDSSIKEQLQLLTGQEFGIHREIDAKLFGSYSAEGFSIADFFRENSGKLQALYENMEVIKTEKAGKEGLLSEEQVVSLENYVLEDKEGNRIETTCYLVILPEKEFREIFWDISGDIKLCVYLDREKRIVRICTLPGEILVTDTWEGGCSLDLTGMEAVTDRLEITFSCTEDADSLYPALSGKIGTEGSFLIEKDLEAAGTFEIEGDCLLSYQKNTWGLMLDGKIQGERTDTGEKLSLVVENLTWKWQDEVICRLSGRAAFEPLAESIGMPSGKEYRIGEMNELETLLFLGECTENAYKNYSGYIKLLQ